MVGNRSAAEQRLPQTTVPLKLNFAAQKKGGMAVSAVWRTVYFLAPCPSEPKEQTAAQKQCLWLGASNHCPSEIELCSGKEGGMAVSAVWRTVYFLAPCPSESKGADRSTKAVPLAR